MRIWRTLIVLALMGSVTTGGPAAAATRGAAAGSAVTGTDSGNASACVDTPLTITFASAPTLGTTGSITVHNADGSVADRIDLADPASFTETVGGARDEAGNPHSFSYYPVIITGDTATIYLHHELAYGRAYYVTADPTAFTAAGFAGVGDPRAWRFTTTRRHPRPNARIITVDSRGRGEFCTVQGAIDAIPASNAVPRLIKVAEGTYHAGYVTQIRNGQGQNGYVFYDDTLTHAAGVADGSVYLARIDPTVYPYSQAVYIDTTMDSHISPAGWLLNNADCPAAPHARFWEYGSVTPQGQPVGTSQRLPCSRQLTAMQAVQWSDPAFVLGGWVPPTVNAAVNAGTAGTTVDVHWSAPAGHSAADVIALCAVRAPRCQAAQRVATTASIGTASFPAPPGRGAYQARYYARGLITAVSAAFPGPRRGRSEAGVTSAGSR